MALTNKQEVFINEYLKCFNATKAAKAAGYSDKTAYSSGQRLLKQDEIAARVRERLSESAMDANEVLYHLAQIARGDMDDIVDYLGNLDLMKARDLGKTNLIKRVRQRSTKSENSDTTETETEAYDRLKALELIGKHLKLFTERQEVTGRDGAPIEYAAKLSDLSDDDIDRILKQAGVSQSSSEA